MKQILLILKLICFISSCCVSQIPQPGDNILNPNLDKFIGTWKWVSGTSELTIQLKKVNYLSFDNIREDVLMGVHTYVENGVIIENYIYDFPNIGQGNKGTIFVWGKMNNVNPDDVTGTLKDPLKYKQNYLSLKYLDGVTPQLIWHISNLRGPIVPKKVNGITVIPTNTFTLPQDIILVRQ